MNYYRFLENLIKYITTTIPSLPTGLLKDNSQYLGLKLNIITESSFNKYEGILSAF